MGRLRQQVLKAEEVAQRPVIDTTQTVLMELLNTNSYQKGGWVLHMLRSQVGDSAFFRGIRSYYKTYRHRNALTDDLRAEVEKSSGQDLKWFFDQWLRRPGFAQVTTSWTYDQATQKVTVEIRQDDRFGFYRFPITVQVGVDPLATRQRVDVPAQAVTRVELPGPVAQRPTVVVFDGDVRLLATIESH